MSTYIRCHDTVYINLIHNKIKQINSILLIHNIIETFPVSGK